jgi:NRPS condensation-like uncharacterized protein
MLIAQYIISVCKLYLIYYLISKLGIFLGLLSLFIIFYIRTKFFKIFFNLEKLPGSDLCFVSHNKYDRLNLIGVLLIDNFDRQKLSKVIKKGIESVPRFHNQLVEKFYSYFWKPISPTEASSRVKILSPMKSEEEFLNYCKAEANNYLDIFKEPPFVIEIVPFGENKGGIMFKLEHLLSDGLGVIGLLCLLSDNYDKSIFPQVMQKNVIPLYKRFLNELLIDISFIYYGPYLLISQQFMTSCRTPMKDRKRPIGNTTLDSSKHYDLNMTKKLTKKLGITVNDLILMIISKSLSKICFKEGYTDVTNFTSFIDIGKASLPNNIEELEIGNNTTGIVFNLPVVKDIPQECKSITQLLRGQIQNVGLANAIVKLADFLYEFLPLDVNIKITKTLTDNIDFDYSNIPGPLKEISLDGCKAYSLLTYATVSMLSMSCFTVVSYNGKHVLVVGVNDAIDFDKKLFIEYFDHEYQELISVC